MIRKKAYAAVLGGCNMAHLSGAGGFVYLESVIVREVGGFGMISTEELERLAALDWTAEQPDSAHGWWVVEGADDSGDGGMHEPTARAVASAPALARELLAARKVVEAARLYVSNLTEGDFVSVTRESAYNAALSAYDTATGAGQ